MKHDISLYQLTDSEKESLVKRLTQDVTWDQDELIDSEQDVQNTEIESQDETEGLI